MAVTLKENLDTKKEEVFFVLVSYLLTLNRYFWLLKSCVTLLILKWNFSVTIGLFVLEVGKLQLPVKSVNLKKLQ